jgi:hypothetical protein
MAAGILFDITLRDKRGHTGVVRQFYNDASATAFVDAVNAVQGALANLSNAAIQRYTGSLATEPSYGAAGQFQDIEDKARLIYTTSVGTVHHIDVPAPKAAIFLADLETVDPTNALVTAFNTLVLANVANRDGTPFANYVVGTRRRVRMRRKNTIWTLIPAETGPEE